jgi:hypothetical protein
MGYILGYGTLERWGIVETQFWSWDMALSDSAVRTLKPGEKPFKHYDRDGLFLLVNPNGSKLWRWRYRFGGKEKLMALGEYPIVSLAQARERQFVGRKKLSASIDPMAERKAETESRQRTAETTQREAESSSVKRKCALILTTAVLSGACTAQSPSMQAPAKLSLVADLGPFKVAAPIFIRVTETNTSSEILNCTGRYVNGVDLTYTFTVWDSDGHLLQPRSDASDYPSNVRKCVLKPGAVHSNEQLVSWLYDMSVPGWYSVQVSRQVTDDKDEIMKSNIIKVEVK